MLNKVSRFFIFIMEKLDLPDRQFNFGGKALNLSTPAVMGILNLTQTPFPMVEICTPTIA